MEPVQLQKQDSLEDVCAICLCKLKDVVYLKCVVHKFCRQCLLDNYEQSDLCPMCREKYEISDIKDSKNKPLINSIWGQVYYQQGFPMGMGTYYFNYGKPYICYEVPHFSWKLKSGAKLPLKKFLKDVKYNPASRNLQCKIDWSEDPFYPDQVTWEMNLNFSKNFDKIESGHRIVTKENGTQETQYHYGSTTFYIIQRDKLIQFLRHPIAAISALY